MYIKYVDFFTVYRRTNISMNNENTFYTKENQTVINKRDLTFLSSITAYHSRASVFTTDFFCGSGLFIYLDLRVACFVLFFCLAHNVAFASGLSIIACPSVSLMYT